MEEKKIFRWAGGLVAIASAGKLGWIKAVFDFFSIG
jgi:hypothetical protein